MREYQKELKYLKKCKNSETNTFLTKSEVNTFLAKSELENRKQLLRYRISNIAKKLEGEKRLKKLLNGYKNQETDHICSAIKDFVNHVTSLNTNVLVVLENLDVNDFKLSRENNKMVSMWSRAKIVRKLEETLLANGIEVAYVDPAYTSQACPICHNINKKNRDGEDFLCTCCGHKADADNNAGVNIANRYNDTEISNIVEKYSDSNTLKHKEIRKIFAKRHREYLKNMKISKSPEDEKAIN
jgi:IS605 OrfB family transposase